ncbi:hypothetical protein Tco_0908860 [Tanacetum coccineum]|uniref:Uncharacterized protein n=1 Tax=Tanacetum coccineum TaxID=301880 RepID=A0ABQ5CPF9_9ASTR
MAALVILISFGISAGIVPNKMIQELDDPTLSSEEFHPHQLFLHFNILLILLRHPEILLSVVHLRDHHNRTYMRSLLLDGGKGNEIPLGRPYRTQPNGVLKMMSTRKRVRPLPSCRLASRHSSDYSSSDSLSERSSYSVTSHPPSPFAGPSRKRCRSTTTYVPLTIPAPEALSPTCDNLLPPRKRFKSSSAALSPEASVEGSMEIGSEEEDIDYDIMADIEADIAPKAAASAGFRSETDVGFEGDDEAEEVAESSARGTVKIGIDRIVGIEEEQRAQKGRVVTKEAQRTRLLDRIGVLEKDNMILRGMLCVERDRIGSLRCCNTL